MPPEGRCRLKVCKKNWRIRKKPSADGFHCVSNFTHAKREFRPPKADIIAAASRRKPGGCCCMEEVMMNKRFYACFAVTFLMTNSTATVRMMPSGRQMKMLRMKPEKMKHTKLIAATVMA